MWKSRLNVPGFVGAALDFDPAAIDRLLGQLESRPWPADWSRLLVLLLVQDSVGTYLLGEDSLRGWGQREALAGIARRRGIPAVLPRTAAGVDAVRLEQVAQAEAAALLELAAAYGATAVLHGTMRMRADGLWDTHWSLASAPGDPWQAGATTFDRAIASGLEGSALRLAGRQ